MTERQRSKEARSRRENLFATLLLLLLPGCMFIGMLAPAAMTVGADEASPVSGPSSFVGSLTKTPLSGPIDFIADQAAKIVDLAWLFSDSKFVPYDENRRILLAQEQEQSGPIVFGNAVLEYAGSGGAGEPALEVDTSPIIDPAYLALMPGMIDTDGHITYDDFPGLAVPVLILSANPPTPVVPEPSTGLLLGTGLLLLAGRNRRA